MLERGENAIGIVSFDEEEIGLEALPSVTSASDRAVHRSVVAGFGFGLGLGDEPVAHSVCVDHDEARSGLAEDLRQPHGFDHFALDDVCQDSPRADGGKLVDVADEDQSGRFGNR